MSGHLYHRKLAQETSSELAAVIFIGRKKKIIIIIIIIIIIMIKNLKKINKKRKMSSTTSPVSALKLGGMKQGEDALPLRASRVCGWKRHRSLG